MVSFLLRLLLWGGSFFLRWLLVPVCVAGIIALHPPTLGNLLSKLILFAGRKLNKPNSKLELRHFNVQAIHVWGWRVVALEATVLESQRDGSIEAAVLLLKSLEVRPAIKVCEHRKHGGKGADTEEIDRGSPGLGWRASLPLIRNNQSHFIAVRLNVSIFFPLSGGPVLLLPDETFRDSRLRPARQKNPLVTGPRLHSSLLPSPFLLLHPPFSQHPRELFYFSPACSFFLVAPLPDR